MVSRKDIFNPVLVFQKRSQFRSGLTKADIREQAMLILQPYKNTKVVRTSGVQRIFEQEGVKLCTACLAFLHAIPARTFGEYAREVRKGSTRIKGND